MVRNAWNRYPKWHQFPAALIALFVELVLSAPTSLRGASGALRLVWLRLFGDDSNVPCSNTGRLWILRLGLYEISCPKEKADDWVWIVDHTIQISSVKCLLIVGCRLSQWQQASRPLTHRDLRVLALEPVEKSTGEIVHEQFTRLAEVTGTPRAIVSDGGADLQRGTMLFRQEHSEVAAIYDITHKTALFLQKLLTKDSRWVDFLQQMAHCKKQFARSSLAFLAPPKVRDQSRYMNVEELMRWATRVRRLMDDPTGNVGELVEPWRVKLEFAWLGGFDEALAEWQTLMEIVRVTLEYVRNAGYHSGAASELGERLAPQRNNALANSLIESILEFVTDQSAQARPNERLIGTSECLESLIGKGKRLEGQQSRSGFTQMILGMAAAVVTPTQEFIEAALSAIKTCDVLAWAKRTLGLSVQARRRRAYAAADNWNKTGINGTPAVS